MAVRGPFEAPLDPHLIARGTFVELDGIRQPAAAPRFSRTPGSARPATSRSRGGAHALGPRAARLLITPRLPSGVATAAGAA